MLNRREAVRLLAATPAVAAAFQSKLPTGIERPWIGSDYWANPLQDWRLRDGRMECFVAGGDRNVYLLTHELKEQTGTLAMRVKFGKLEGADPKDGFIGFRIGIRGYFNDYRDSAIYGYGLEAGVTADGRLFIGKPAGGPRITVPLDNLELVLEAADSRAVTLRVLNAAGRELASVTRENIPTEWLKGGVALLCHSGEIHESPDPRSINPTFAVGAHFGAKLSGSQS